MSDESEVRKGMPLHGKKGLIAGVANEHSIAYGCAKALRDAGADLAITYLNAKAEPYVRPLAEKLKSPIIVACDVREPGQLEAVFARIRVHALSPAPLKMRAASGIDRFDELLERARARTLSIGS